MTYQVRGLRIPSDRRFVDARQNLTRNYWKTALVKNYALLRLLPGDFCMYPPGGKKGVSPV